MFYSISFCDCSTYFFKAGLSPSEKNYFCLLHESSLKKMKNGIIEYKNKNIFLKNHAENEAGRLVPDLFLFFKKALYEVKARDLQLSFNHFR